MELVKNIFFNTDKLVQNSKIKISYIGDLLERNSKEVYIRYTFNENWEDAKDEEMIKSELGFQIEIDLGSNNTFNFCLKNENDEWDNNNGVNYNFEIEEQEELSLIEIKSNLLDNKKHLRKTYMWSKKAKLAIYKMLIFIPKLISGNYKKRVKDN